MTATLEAARARWSAVIERGPLSRRVALLYAALYLHYGVYGVFMPMWFQHKGMSPSQIGTLLALPLLLRIVFVAPVTALADRLRRVRDVLFICVALTAALVFLVDSVNSFIGFLVFFTLFAVAWDPLPILADGYASAAVRVRQLNFGHVRVWGTITCVAAAVGGGSLLDHVGVNRVPIITGLLLVTPLLVIPFLPPDKLFGDPVPAAPGEWRTIVRDRPAMLVLVGMALLTSSSCMLLGFSSIQWSSRGISQSSIGLLFGAAAASEILVFSFTQKWLGERSELWLMVVGAALTTIRWLGMATDPDLKFIFLLQLLHGPGGATTIAGCILYIARRFPTHLVATANGVNAVLIGLSTSAVMFAGGHLWDAMKALAYLPMAGLTLSALGIFIFSVRRHDRDCKTGLAAPIAATT